MDPVTKLDWLINVYADYSRHQRALEVPAGKYSGSVIRNLEADIPWRDFLSH